MSDVIGEFIAKYNIDEITARTLQACAPGDQLKVLTTFDPRGTLVNSPQDHSSKLMALIGRITFSTGMEDEGLGMGLGGGFKRGRQEMESGMAGGAELGSFDLESFRLRYPMDDRAYDYLSSSAAAVQAKVMQEFKPRNENDADYSSLVTTMVKRARTSGGGGAFGGGVAGGFGQAAAFGPSTSFGAQGQVEAPDEALLQDFRGRYPMDDRAWEFLTTSPGAIQASVLSEFKPRSEGDADYSAAITSFVRTVKGRGGGAGLALHAQQGPSRQELEAFVAQYPMDERALDFLSSSTPAVQADVLRSFKPRDMQDSDYSRPITCYIKQARDRMGGGFGAAAGAGGKGASKGGKFGGSIRPPTPGASSDGWLGPFRKIYPMDDRAFEFLSSSSPEVQETVTAEFKPRRPGELDYSGAVTSFVKMVRTRLEACAPTMGSHALREMRDPDATPPGMLQAFKARYPMDDRAWDFLTTSPAAVQKDVLERFRPQREGEADYSRLITSFVKASRGR